MPFIPFKFCFSSFIIFFSSILIFHFSPSGHPPPPHPSISLNMGTCICFQSPLEICSTPINSGTSSVLLLKSLKINIIYIFYVYLYIYVLYINISLFKNNMYIIPIYHSNTAANFCRNVS